MSKVKNDAAKVIDSVPRIVVLPQKEVAKIQKDRQQRSLDVAVDQVTGMAKWLTASLFAANSAGVITVLNSANKLSDPTIPASLFSAGLILALLSGTVIQEIYNRLSDPLADLVEYWAEIEAGAPMDQERQEKICGRVEAISKWSWTAPVPGWISGVLFVGASFAVAFGFK